MHELAMAACTFLLLLEQKRASIQQSPEFNVHSEEGWWWGLFGKRIGGASVNC